MQCPKCKMQIKDGIKICPFCGENLDSSQESNMNEQQDGLSQLNNMEMSQPNMTSQSNNVGSQEKVTSEQNKIGIQPNNVGIPQSKATSPISRKKMNKTTWIIVGIVLVIVLVIGVLMMLKKSPKQIFESSIDQVYRTINDSLVKKVTSEKGSYSLKMKVEPKDATAKSMLDIINKISLSGNYEIDYDNMIMNMGIRTKYDNDTLLNLDFYTSKNKGYLYLPGLYDKYIMLDMTNSSKEETLDKEQLSIVLEEGTKALKKSFKKEYFNSMDTTISVNGKETKVKQNVLELDTKRIYEMQKVVLTELKKNDKFLTSMSKLSKKTKDELKEIMDEMSQEELPEETSNEKVNFVIYTKGISNKVVAVQMETITDNETVTVDFQKENDTYYFQVMNHKETTLKGSLAMKEDGNAMLDVSVINIADIKLDFTHQKEENVKVTEKEVSNAISQNQLTEAESAKIQQELFQNKGLIKLIQDIQTKIVVPYGY